VRVLYLAPRIPFPELDRENVRPYQQLRFLALRHDVDLVTFGGTGSEWDARRVLRRFCSRIQILPTPVAPVVPATARHVFAREPLAVQRYESRDLHERLVALNETRRYDLIFNYSLSMAPYGAAFPNTPKVLDLVEVTSLRWREYGEMRRFLASAVFRREAGRLRQIELAAVKDYQRVLLASETEAEVLRGLVPGCKRIASLKTPAPPHAPLMRRASGVPTIVIAGHLDYMPNQDAVMHFVRDVFPLIRNHYPDTVLRIAGRNPPLEIRALANEPGIYLDDRCKDLRELFATAWVAVVPHRVGRGVRNEVLEALTFGVPTVVSRAAFVGLDALPGTDIVVSDNAADMALKVQDLFNDPAGRDHMGFRARRAMLNNYSHWSIALRLEEIVEAAARESLTPA
jgi:sugar transferase (PEP-CTERM/EpsH1 system associated)